MEEEYLLVRKISHLNSVRKKIYWLKNPFEFKMEEEYLLVRKISHLNSVRKKIYWLE